MNKVAFVTDSVTSMPADYVKKYNIHVVPNILIWSGKEYRDWVDMTPSEFNSRLKTSRELPTTAAAAPDAYREVFARLLAEGYDICAVIVSSTMSRTYDSAREAKETLGADNITVIDSQTMGMAVGWPILQGARAAEKGASLEECADLVRKGLANTGTIMTVDTLEYLQRSGRIGWGQRYMGTLLNIKPIMEMIDGQIVPVERVRTRKKALAQLVEMTVDKVNGRSPLYIAIGHCDAEKEAKILLDMMREQLQPEDYFITEGSPNVGIVAGPGLLVTQFMAGVSDFQ